MGRIGLVRTLKGVIVFLAVLTAFGYGVVFPQVITEAGDTFPELAYLVHLGIAAVSVSAIPIAVALVLFWRVCTDIGRDESFSLANARRLSGIGFCALVDAAYCAVGTVVVVLVAGSPVWLWGAAATVLGVGIAVAAFLLSHLVLKAAALKEDSDLTI